MVGSYTLRATMKRRERGDPTVLPAGRSRLDGPMRLRRPISSRSRMALGALGLVLLVAAWWIGALMLDTFLFPTPPATLEALGELWTSGELVADTAASLQRIVLGYSLSLLIGIGLGVLIGSFATVDSFTEPQLGMLRYIPASALGPLVLLWLGIDEAPKIALVVIGTVFYNILMVSDVVRNVPMPLIDAAYTLGANRRTVLRKVILPHSWPGIIDVARINLAAAWLMLVVAELLAAQEGLAFRIIRAQRFRRVDRMFALLLVFGLIGILSDAAFRAYRRKRHGWATQ